MIYDRQINVLDYGDACTQRRLGAKRQNTFLAIRPSAFSCVGRIISILHEQKFTVRQLKMIKITQGLAQIMFEALTDEPMQPFLVDQFTNGISVVMELVGDDAVNRLIKLIESSAEPGDVKPPSRLLFGIDKLRVAVFVSKTLQMADTHVKTFFGELSPKVEPVMDGNTTLCIVKPHAVKEGKAGAIIDAILGADLRITAMKLFHLERENSEEFFEVYKGVVPEYVQMCLQLVSGPCIAMEVLGKTDNSNSYQELRSLCGPVDPDIARQIRPQTLRARFGVNKIQNAVHCTDLEEDTQLEVEFFFKILH